jgi:hypothetical protein
VKGSWFGVGLDGITLDPNATGMGIVNNSSATIGGSTPEDRNVFAQSATTGISMGGNSGGANAIKGNYFGALPNGTPVASPGSGAINISGPIGGTTIGGDAATAGQCDGECNLISGYASHGIVTNDAGGAPTALTIRGNFIGLGLDGTSDQGNGGSGIQLSQAHGTTIGGAAATQRNYIVGNDDGGIFTSLTNTLTVQNNYIGLPAGGTGTIPNTRSTDGAGVWASGGGGGTFEDNRFAGNGLRVGVTGSTIQGNLIGVGPAGESWAIAGEPGLQLEANGMIVGGTNPGDANTIGNVTTLPVENNDGAVFLTFGSSGDTIQGNFIGTTSTGVSAPNSGTGILMGGSNFIDDNVVGGTTAAAENVISNSGRDAIADIKAGNGNQFLRNVGKNNGAAANDLFIDLGGDGPGNPGGSAPNDGIQAPSGMNIAGTTLQGPAGSAVAGATIRVYKTYTSHGDIREFLFQTTAFGDGSWNIGLGTLPDGQCVTVNQTEPVEQSSSEMAVPVAVGGGSCVAPPQSSINSGPADGSTITVPTATFGFSTVEAGATLECSLDGAAFTACTSPLTTPPLANGAHTFQVRATQSTLYPALSPELGSTNTRSFTVAVPPPPPAETGQRAAALKKCKKKKTKKAKKKCRKKARKLPL